MGRILPVELEINDIDAFYLHTCDKPLYACLACKVAYAAIADKWLERTNVYFYEHNAHNGRVLCYFTVRGYAYRRAKDGHYMWQRYMTRDVRDIMYGRIERIAYDLVPQVYTRVTSVNVQRAYVRVLGVRELVVRIEIEQAHDEHSVH